VTRSMVIAVAVAALLVGGAAGWKLVRPLGAKAQSGCSLSSFQGSFGNQYNGFIFPFPGAPAMVPIADVGHVIVDGNGNYSSSDTFSVNGLIVRTTQSGTYTVNSDCTGTSTGKDSLGSIITTAFVIVNGGAQINAVYTDIGVSVSTVLTRQ
jgi:hypothetical protein